MFGIFTGEENAWIGFHNVNDAKVYNAICVFVDSQGSGGSAEDPVSSG